MSQICCDCLVLAHPLEDSCEAKRLAYIHHISLRSKAEQLIFVDESSFDQLFEGMHGRGGESVSVVTVSVSAGRGVYLNP